MFRSMRQVELDSSAHRRWKARFPVVAGVLLSVGNPFFLIWWATVGAALVLRSARFGVGGLLAFVSVHWLCDFVWCYFLSALSFKGGRFFGHGFQKVVFVVCGVFLVSFGGKYLFEAVRVFFV